MRLRQSNLKDHLYADHAPLHPYWRYNAYHLCCNAYAEIRNRIVKEYCDLSQEINYSIVMIANNPESLCQFILDPTNLNFMKSVQPTIQNYLSFTDYLGISVKCSSIKKDEYLRIDIAKIWIISAFYET